MKIYISGPMRGIPEFNFPAFHAAAARLRVLGHEVINPAELDAATNTTGWVFEDFIQRDFDVILSQRVEAIALLDGWQKSQGATMELNLMRGLKRDVYTFDAARDDASVLMPLVLPDAPSVQECPDPYKHSHAPPEAAPRIRGHKDKGLRCSLVSEIAQVYDADVTTRGAKKYAADNWRDGLPARAMLDAIDRHLLRYKLGENFDDDGQHNLASVRFFCAGLQEMELRIASGDLPAELDDRWNGPGRAALLAKAKELMAAARIVDRPEKS